MYSPIGTNLRCRPSVHYSTSACIPDLDHTKYLQANSQLDLDTANFVQVPVESDRKNTALDRREMKAVVAGYNTVMFEQISNSSFGTHRGCKSVNF